MGSGYPQGRDQRGRAHTPTGRCRDCRATVLWATTPSGKRMPFDMRRASADATPRPYAIFERADDWRLAVMLHDAELAGEIETLGDGVILAECHWDTCPERQPRMRERADLA